MDLVQMAKELRGVIVQVTVSSAGNVGSGFWVSDKGLIATCWHVVRSDPNATFDVRSAIDPHFDLQRNNMIYANWQAFSARLVCRDEENDVALLKVDNNPLQGRSVTPISIGGTALKAHFKQAALDPKLPEAGEKVLLAGYPLGSPYPVTTYRQD
jgi:S1-C subfamily serine protease